MYRPIVKMVCNEQDCYVGNLYDSPNVDTLSEHHERNHPGHKVFAFFKED